MKSSEKVSTEPFLPSDPCLEARGFALDVSTGQRYFIILSHDKIQDELYVLGQEMINNLDGRFVAPSKMLELKMPWLKDMVLTVENADGKVCLVSKKDYQNFISL